MAYAPNTYTTNGTDRDYNITFPFLRESDIRVTVFDASGNLLTDSANYDFSIQKPDATFQVRVVQNGTIGNSDGGTALAAGSTVTISRVTDISTLVTVFQDGSSLRASDINALISQINFALEEFGDNTTSALGKNITQTAWDATSLRITNLAQPTANNDAVRKVDVDSGIGSDITTVAGIAANVTSVSNAAANIGTVAADLSGSDTIGTVSTNIANVNTVSGNIANVNAVAADATDIGTVAADIQVGGPDNIGTVANAVSNVGIVAGNVGQVQTVATNIADVTTVAADATDIGTVSTNIANVNTVAGNISDVNTLAPQATNISTLTQTANLTALQNAATNAAAAEAALNAFNRTYLGAYASDPSVDNNGDALTDGDLYFNSTSNNLKFYDAGNSAWITLNNSVQVNSAATLQAVGDVDFSYAGGQTLSGNNFIVRDATNARWENATPAGVRTILNVEDGATADQTGAEIKAAYEAESDTNAFSDAQVTKLAGIEDGATADQTGAEIKTAYEAESDTNAFSDAEKTKLTNAATLNAAADFGANDLLADHIYATGDGTNNGKLDLQCSAGTHAVTLEGPDYSGAYSYTVKLPQSAPAAGQTLQQNSANDQLVWATPASGGGALVTDMTDITLTAAMNEALTIFSPATSSSVQTQTFTIPSGKTALYVYAVGKGGDGGDVYINSTTGYYGWGMPGQPGGTGCTRIALNDTELAGQNLTLRIDSAGNAEVLLPNAANTVICRGSAGIDYIDVLGSVNLITNTQIANPTQTQVLAIAGSTNTYLAPKANQSLLARWYQSVGGDLRYNGVSSGVGWEARTTVKTTNLAINNYFGWGMSFEGDIQTTEVRDGSHRYWTWRPGSNALITASTVEDGTLASRTTMATQFLREFAFDRFVEPGVYLAQVQQDPDFVNSMTNRYSGRHSTAPLPGLIADSNYLTYMVPNQVSSGYNNVNFPQQAWNGFSSDPIDNNNRLLLNAPDRTAAQIGHGGMGGFAGHTGASIDSSAKGLGGAGGPAGIFILAV